MSQPHTILVVDDNETGRYVKTRMLRQAGYNVIEVRGGFEALNCVNRDLPALVVLDVRLPDVDGLEVCRRVKREPETAHVMVLQTSASRVSPDDRLAGLDIGADGYLIEPFGPQEFLALVKALLRLYDRQVENRELIEHLRERDARSRAWFDNSSIGLCETNISNGRLLSANRYFCNLLGYSEEELLARTIFEITHPDDREEDRRGFRQLADGEIAKLRLEKRQQKKDGGFVWTEVTVNLVAPPSNRPLRAVAVVQDITARKRHQQTRALLLEVTRSVIESEDSDTVLSDAIFQRVSDCLDTDFCFNYRFDRQAGLLRLVNSAGVPRQGLAAAQELALGQAYCGLVAEQLTPLIADRQRIEKDERGQLVRSMGVRAYVCHPLIARGGEVLGTLSFGSSRRERFYPDEIAIMHEIADVLALAWERKGAEERLQRERDTLNLALLAGQMGVYDLDIVHDRLWWSPEIYTVFGVPPEIFTPTREGFNMFVHPDDRAELWRRLDESFKKREPFSHEFRIVRPDGQLRWIANRAHTEYHCDGHPVRHLGIAIDITERHGFEEAARRWQRLFEQSDFSLAHADARSNTFSAVNAAFARERGYRPKELAGKAIFTVYPESLHESLRQSMAKADQTGHELFETYHRRKDGSVFPVLLEINSFKGADGAVQNRMVYALDISTQREAEAALRASEEQFRAFFELAAVGTVVCDAHGRILRANEQFCGITGYSADELLGMRTYDLTHPDDRAAHAAAAEQWRDGKSPYFHVEKRYRRKDGTAVWVRVNGNLMRDERGGIVRTLGIVEDITERKRIQMNADFLLRLGRELGQLNDADAIAERAIGAAANYLGVSSCAILSVDPLANTVAVEFEWHQDGGTRSVSHHASDFVDAEMLALLRSGEAIAVEDVSANPHTRDQRDNFAALGVAAFMVAPYISNGELEALLTVSVSAPRAWLRDELRCLQNVVARVWGPIKRARTVSALRASEAQLRLIADNLPVYIAHCDVEQRFRFVNQPYAERFGLRAAAVVGKTIAEVLGQAAYESFCQYVEAALAGRMVEFEQTVPYESGVRQMRCAYVPETDEHGAVCGFFALIQDVTAQRLAEEERAQLAAIVASSRDAILSFSPDGTILTWNRAATQLLGWPETEARGQRKTIFVPEEKLAESEQIFARALRGEAVHQFETVRRRRDGSLVEVSVTLSPVRVGGAVVAISEIIRDVTERKRAESALVESEARLRLALESADAGMWDLDLETGAMIWSPENCRLYGIAPEQFIPAYESWRSVVHADDLVRIESQRSEKIRAGRPYRTEYRIRKSSGEVRWLASHGKAYPNEQGKPARMLGINIDITERKRIEEERLKFQALVESSSDYIGMAEPDGNCFYLNPAGRALVGVDSPEEMLSHRPEDFIADEDRQRFIETVVPALREVGRWEGEIRLKHQKSGAAIDAHRSLFLVKDPHSGAPLCIGTVSRDVREQKHLQRLLQQRVEELREADRAKDEFLALLAHELRNPLAPITNTAKILRRSVPSDDKLHWCVDVIEGQLGNMSRMLEDLLDVSRITRNKLELRKEQIALGPVLEQAIETSRPMIEMNEHHLICFFPDTPIWVEGDATRLSQVIANLLNNSAKYTDPGGRIELRVAAVGGDHVEIRVADNGRGIAAELLPQIFDLFTQGDDKAKSGLGIGLTVCKNLIEMHGGTLQAQSAGVGQGSEFVVRLPIIEEPKGCTPANNSESKEALRSLRILVVDDNREQAETLAALLTVEGHQVRVASEGRSALALAADFAPEVGLIDIGMPEMDGCELARRLRAEPALHDTVLIAQTGWGRTDDRQRTQAAGFDHHLVKPLNHKVLEGILRVVGSRQ